MMIVQPLKKSRSSASRQFVVLPRVASLIGAVSGCLDPCPTCSTTHVAITQSQPSAVTPDPSGRFLYVANTTSGSVSAFAVQSNSSSSKSLAPNIITTVARFLYVTSQTDDTLSIYSVAREGLRPNGYTFLGKGDSASGVAADPK